MALATVTMVGPAGVTVIIGQSGTVYNADANGVFTVNVGDVTPLLNQGFTSLRVGVHKASFNSPVPADLTTTVNAVTPSNVALTIAAQPPHARKLQIRIVIGTTTTTAITAGNLALVGTDQDGNAITENISMIQNASATLKSKYAYATLTSATVSAYAAAGSGTGNTIGLGPSNDFGIPSLYVLGSILTMVCTKATKITKVLGTSNIAADDVAATTTVDAVARTVAPTTAPAANGLVDYEFTINFNVAA